MKRALGITAVLGVMLVFQNCSPSNQFSEEQTSQQSSTAGSESAANFISGNTETNPAPTAPAVVTPPKYVPPVTSSGSGTQAKLITVHTLLLIGTNSQILSGAKSEGPSTVYVGPEMDFQVSDRQASNFDRAIYRCRHNTELRHFASPDSNCEGHVSEGLIGYISSYISSNAPRALRRYFSDSRNAHLITAAGGVALDVYNRDEGILGYVP